MTSDEDIVAGVYTRTGQQDGRPVYIRENDDMFLYYLERKKKWHFSRGNTDARRNSHWSADRAMCPTDDMMAKGSWFDWRVTKWVPEPSTVIEGLYFKTTFFYQQKF